MRDPKQTPLTTLALLLTGWPVAAQNPPALTLAEALRTTLSHHPQVRIQEQQVAAQRGVKEQAAGQFDLALTGDASQGHSYQPLTGYQEFQYSQYDGTFYNSAATYNSQVSLGASQEFRNGIVVSPTLTASRITDNLTNRTGINQGGIQFSVTVPLLRGRGRAVVTAQEESSARQIEAALFEVNETISGLLATVVSSYWNVVAAAKQLEVLRGSEARASALAESTMSLIQADRLPRSDANEIDANRAIREANRLTGEQRLVEARQQLASDMGIAAADVSTLPEIADGFPAEMEASEIPSRPAELKAYIQMALDQRPELRALKKREEATRITETASRDALRPELNVRVTTGFSGLDEGTGPDKYLLSPVHAVRGLDLLGGVTYRFAPARHAAAGLMEQSSAAARQAELQYEDLARKTAAAVGPALFGLRSEAMQLRRTRDSVQFYRNALDAEREKLRMGAGSVINTLTVEDRLTGALESEVQAELEYAQALLRLRQATSTIVAPDGPVQSVNPAIFSTPPALPASASNTTSKAGTPQ